MKKIIQERLFAKRKELKKLQEYFKTDINNIKMSNYEDKAISDLISMKKLKAEIDELEKLLQFQY